MALDIRHFVRLRPYLYHLTAQRNLVHIRKDMLLKPSNTLFAEAGETALSRTVRRGPRVLSLGDRQIELRDQDPLHAGKISFLGDWTLEDLVSHLNNHVFFWPGWEHGPVLSGKNHFERYADEKPIILRVKIIELLQANNGIQPLFCQYNSGAARCTKGRGSPRGPQTFMAADYFHLPPTRVVEVTFRSTVRLPVTIEAKTYPNNHWHPLGEFSPSE